MGFLSGDPGDEDDFLPRRYHRRYVPVLWTDMRLHCFECGHKWTARVCMEEPATDCPECKAEVAIPLPKEPRKRIR